MIGVENNRFLQRVNPEITRAVADSGSSLNHSELQRLMRQMVDLNIADNLKLWVHRDLVKTRTVSGDTFVTKGYDVSGEENDVEQATNDNEPKLVSEGMEFDGSDSALSCGNILGGDTEFTVNMWIKFSTVANGGTLAETIMALVLKATAAATSLVNNNWAIFYDRRTAYQYLRLMISNNGGSTHSSTYITNVPANMSTNYNMVTCIYNQSNRNQSMYLNGSHIQTITNAVTSINNIDVNFSISSLGSRAMDGILNDVRYFNKALSATEISAIYNTTKGYYGIT